MFLGSTICKIMCVGIFCRCIKKDVHLISDPLSLYIALRINDAFPLRILECIYCWLSSPQGDWHPSTTKKSPFHRHVKKNSFAPVQNWPLIFSEVCMKATYPTCLNLLLCPIQMWSYLIASDLFVMSSDMSSVLLQGHHTIILLFLYFWYNHPLLNHQKKDILRVCRYLAFVLW